MHSSASVSACLEAIFWLSIFLLLPAIRLIAPSGKAVASRMKTVLLWRCVRIKLDLLSSGRWIRSRASIVSIDESFDLAIARRHAWSK